MADTGKTVMVLGGVAAAGAVAWYWLKGRGEAAPGTAALYGTVTDDLGLPLPGVSVTLNGWSGATNGNGQYQLKGIEPGAYTVRFYKAGYEGVQMSVNLYGDVATPINVTLVPEGVPVETATLYGRVTDVDTGQPLMGVFVSVDGYSAYTNPLGDYEITNIPPGTYEVVFSKAGYETLIV